MKTFYADKRGALVEVTARSGGEVEFHAQGGGFVRRMPSAEFRRRFKPAEPPRFALGAVSGEWLAEGTSIPAFLDGRRWNGWAMPYFPLQSALRVADTMPGCTYHPESDEFRIGSGDEEEVFRPEAIEVDGASVKVYPIGTGGWCWEAVT